MKEEKTNKVDTYLTDIKELPPLTNDMPKEKTVAAKEKPPITKVEKSTNVVESKKEELPKDKEVVVKATEKENSGEILQEEKETKVFTFKDIILGIINLISVIFLIFLLTKIPIKSKEFQAERIKEIQSKEDLASLFGDISKDKEKADKLDKMFLTENGVVNFVNDVEKLKGENKAIKGVTFASQKPIKDKNGLAGLPVVIELRGTWETIGVSLHDIQLLPYLFRAVTIEAIPSKDDPGLIVLKYGGFLYVSENFTGK